MTPDERAALRTLVDAATPGEWDALYGADGKGPASWWMAYHDPDTDRFNWPQVQSDAAFIAAARTAVPALLDALDAAEGARDFAQSERAKAEGDKSGLFDEAVRQKRRANDACAALDRVRALHRDRANTDFTLCDCCDQPPPCATVRAIEGES